MLPRCYTRVDHLGTSPRRRPAAAFSASGILGPMRYLRRKRSPGARARGEQGRGCTWAFSVRERRAPKTKNRGPPPGPILATERAIPNGPGCPTLAGTSEREAVLSNFKFPNAPEAPLARPAAAAAPGTGRVHATSARVGSPTRISRPEQPPAAAGLGRDLVASTNTSGVTSPGAVRVTGRSAFFLMLGRTLSLGPCHPAE